MTSERIDCEWCGSARSVEYGVCQVCLMEFPNEATVITLPVDRVGTPARRARIRDADADDEKATVGE